MARLLFFALPLTLCLSLAEAQLPPPYIGAAPTVRDPARPAPLPARAALAPGVLLQSQYAAMQRRDGFAFAQTFAPDAMVFGPLAHDVYAQPGEAQQFAQRFAASTTAVRSQNLRLRHVGSNCAWAFDEVEIGNHSGRSLRFHVTTLIEGSQVVAQSWSIPVRPTYALAMSNRGGWVDLAPLPARDDPEARSAAAVVNRWLRTKTFAAIQGREDTLLINAWPDDNRVGDRDIMRALEGLRRDPSFSVAPVGNVHSRSVCGGQMSFVAFNQNVAIGTGSGSSHNSPTVRLKTRGLAFFEREGGNRQRPVLLEVSLGHPELP